MNILTIDRVLKSIMKLQKTVPGCLNSSTVNFNGVQNDDKTYSAIYLTNEKDGFKYSACLEYAPEKAFDTIEFDYDGNNIITAEIDISSNDCYWHARYDSNKFTLEIDKVAIFDKYFPGKNLENALIIPFGDIPDCINLIEDYRYFYIHGEREDHFLRTFNNKIHICIIPYILKVEGEE